MRAAAFLSIFAVLVGTACGGKNKKPAMATKFPALACDTLTEAEVTQFIKLLPRFSAALKAATWNPAYVDPKKGMVAALAPLIDGMNVRGVKDTLKAAGTNWGTFRATLYKIFAARLIVGLSKSVTPELVAQMKEDTAQFIQQKYADYVNLQNAAKAIPAANLELAKKYEEELNVLRSIGH